MFDTKLANSIQQDYRNAADTHRLISTANSINRRKKPAQAILLLGSLMATWLIFF